MLAQNFKVAKELGITELQYKSLCLTLSYLETGKVKYFDYDAHEDGYDDGKMAFSGLFNMGVWTANTKCGTVGCIAGTAQLLGGCHFRDGSGGKYEEKLADLFHPSDIDYDRWNDITVEHAARALRNYLTTGEAGWKGIVPKCWCNRKGYLSLLRWGNW